jgi:hypothetical protein
MGLKISLKNYTKAPHSLKLLNKIESFLFEEECGELEQYSPTQIEKIKEVRDIIYNIVLGHGN